MVGQKKEHFVLDQKASPLFGPLVLSPVPSLSPSTVGKREGRRGTEKSNNHNFPFSTWKKVALIESFFSRFNIDDSGIRVALFQPLSCFPLSFSTEKNLFCGRLGASEKCTCKEQKRKQNTNPFISSLLFFSARFFTARGAHGRGPPLVVFSSPRRFFLAGAFGSNQSSSGERTSRSVEGGRW